MANEPNATLILDSVTPTAAPQVSPNMSLYAQSNPVSGDRSDSIVNEPELLLPNTITGKKVNLLQPPAA
jgi:hypothetical protein